MRRLLLIALAAIVLLSLAGWRVLQSQTFWRWGGWELVKAAQDRLTCDLKIAAVQGHPFTGFTFTDVTLTGHQGEILHTDKLELRFSFWSILRLHPVIARLVLPEPRLTLRQDQAGNWEVAHLLRKRPPPPFKSLDFPKIALEHGQATVIRPGGVQRYDDLNLILDLKVLQPRRPDQEIRVGQAVLAATTPLGPFGLKTSLSYAQGQLKIDYLQINRGGQILAGVSGEGKLAPESKAVFALNLGPIPGQVLHPLWPQWPQDWELKGHFHLSILGLTQFALTGAGQVQQSPFNLQGLISREAGQWTYDLQAQLEGLRPELMEPFNPQWARKLKDLTPVAAKLVLKGAGLAWPPEKLDWSLETAAFRNREVRLDQLQISLSGNAREQKLQGQALGNFGQLSLTAAGPLLTSWKGDLKLEAKDCQPALLGLEKARETVLTGKFTGAFSLPSTSASVSMSGDLEARGRLGSQPLEDFRARLTWQQPKLEVPKASLRLGPLAAEFSGACDGDRLNWQGKGSLAAGASKALLPEVDCGPLAFSGALTGTLAAPHLSVQGHGQALGFAGVSLKSFTFKVSGADWPPAAGSLEIRGAGLTTPAGAFSQANLSCRGEANLWQMHFTTGGQEGVQAEFAGTADLRTRPISLVLEKFSWRSKEYHLTNAGPVQLRLLPGLQLASAGFRVNGGDLALQLGAQESRLTGRLTLKNFPAELFHLRGRPLKGNIDGQFSLAGEPAAPLIQGQLNWGPGQLGNFPFQTLKARFDYHAGFLYLAGSLEEKAAGPKLVWDGQVPLHLSLIPLKCSLGQQNLVLTLKGEQINLAMLTVLGPGVQAAQGNVDLSAQWRGDPHHPQVSGQVRWGEGSLKLRPTGTPYRLLPGEARLQGDKITIPDLVLESGAGTLRIAGDLALQSFTPGQLTLRGQAVNFLALNKEGSQIEANANLTLTGPWDKAQLTGQISVTKATFATSFFQGGPHPEIIRVNKPAAKESEAEGAPHLKFWENLQVDLTLQSAGRVWVQNKDLKVDLQGSLKVLKAPGQDKMAIAGVARAVEGTIDIQGRSFKVAEGTVTLHGKPGVPPTLAGRAVAEVDQVTLFLDVTGPVNKPVLRFTSNPPLPPPDVLSYLVFGRAAATLNKEEYASVSQQVFGVVGGLTATKIKDILGPNFPLVCDVNMKCGEQTVGLTKPLTKDLSVSYEHKTDPLSREDTDQMRVEYKVHKYMSLESNMGRRNTGGDVIFNYDF